MKIGNLVKFNRGGAQGLEAALLEALPELLPSLKISRIERQQQIGPSSVVDFVLEVASPLGGKRRLFVEIKETPVPGRIRESLRQRKALLQGEANGYPVLASRFLSPRIRGICQEEGVGYFDLAGNCFLRFEDFYLEKIVDKNPFPPLGRPSSLFTPISSRILRALLEEPKRTWRLSELSQATRASLGQTFKVLKRLLEEEYLKKSKKGLQVVQAAKLLEAWREEYAQEKKNTQVGYYSFERNPEKLMASIAKKALAKKWRYAVTSFAAASLIAPFVRGIGTVQWYVESEIILREWVKALDLRPAEAGPNALLVIPYDAGVFYRPQKVNNITLVCNVQLYLDLYSDPARGREQAEFLRKKKMEF